MSEVSTRSDRPVKVISSAILAIYMAVGIGGIVSAESEVRAGFGVLLALSLLGGWVWTRRHLFRRVTFGSDGIRWVGLLESGYLAWTRVCGVTVNRPTQFLSGASGIDFYRIEVQFLRPSGKRGRLIAGSYCRTPIRLAQRIVKTCPDPKLSSKLSRGLMSALGI